MTEPVCGPTIGGPGAMGRINAAMRWRLTNCSAAGRYQLLRQPTNIPCGI